MTTIVGFDPALYKATQREQWDRAAAAWDDWGPLLDQWLAEATELMLDRARIASGSRVLDVAAGAGGQTLAAARRTGPDGLVVATDIAEELVERVRANASAAGAANVYAAVADAEQLDSEPGAFDAAICRLGLTFMPDLATALRGIHTALRPGGRLSAIVYAAAEHNAFLAIPLEARRTRPRPPCPGPFGLGSPGTLEAALSAAGFVDVAVESVDAPLRAFSAGECARFQRESFSALLDELDDDAWRLVESELRVFEGSAGFVGPCRLLLASGTRA